MGKGANCISVPLLQTNSGGLVPRVPVTYAHARTFHQHMFATSKTPVKPSRS